MSLAQLMPSRFGLSMKMAGLSMKEPIGALSQSSTTELEPWQLTHVLEVLTSFGPPLCTLETLMFSRIKHLVNASNSPGLETLRLPNAQMTHSSNFPWMPQVLDHGVSLKVTGAMTIAVSLALYLFL